MISVIIPKYNIDQSQRKCLDSMISQKLIVKKLVMGVANEGSNNFRCKWIWP